MNTFHFTHQFNGLKKLYVNYYVNKQRTSYVKNSRMSGPTIESESGIRTTHKKPANSPDRSGIYKNSLSLQPLNFEKNDRMNTRKHTFREWMIAIRPWSFPASAMPVITATAYLFWKGADINGLLALWALLNIVIFHAAGNTWSDYFDFRKKVDAEDTFGAKTLTQGMFSPKEILNLSLGLTLVAAIGGIGLLCLTGLPLLWIGLSGIGCTLLYPFLKFNALGDLVILLAYAFLPTIGTSYVATGAIDWSVLLLALPVGLITDGILHANNTRDTDTDKRAGIKTMAMALGARASAILYGFEVLFPYAWMGALAILGHFPLTVFITFLTGMMAFGCARTMMNSLQGDRNIISDLDVKTANLQLMFSALLSLAFIVARFI